MMFSKFIIMQNSTIMNHVIIVKNKLAKINCRLKLTALSGEQAFLRCMSVSKNTIINDDIPKMSIASIVYDM